MELVWIPPGCFTMGSPETEKGRYANEMPHQVCVKGFWMGKTEVTNAQYAAFLNQNGNQNEGSVPWVDMADDENFLTQSSGTFQPLPGFENHPVIQVSWYGARAYCQAVGRRLPTEAEWEKAARGEDGRAYPWGDTAISCDLANYWSQPNGCGGTPVAVGSYPTGASPYGALDMAGNVWEWTEDWFDPAAQDARVVRSGSYLDQAAWATTFHRHRALPVNQYAHTGFRCALTAPVTAAPPPVELARGQTRAVPLPAGGLTVEQVAVPGGSFLMGADKEDDQTIHEVTVDDF